MNEQAIRASIDSVMTNPNKNAAGPSVSIYAAPNPGEWAKDRSCPPIPNIPAVPYPTGLGVGLVPWDKPFHGAELGRIIGAFQTLAPEDWRERVRMNDETAVELVIRFIEKLLETAEKE